jgi:hypothetical protein
MSTHGVMPLEHHADIHLGILHLAQRLLKNDDLGKFA